MMGFSGFAAFFKQNERDFEALLQVLDKEKEDSFRDQPAISMLRPFPLIRRGALRNQRVVSGRKLLHAVPAAYSFTI